MLTTIENKTWFQENSPEGISTSYLLQHAEKLYSEQTPYQLIEVYATEQFGNLLVFDDLIMLSQRENFFYHEMLTHPALLCHSKPRQVAIIGGGDCGSLREVMKHSEIEIATQIEIDERVIRVAEEFFPELCSANTDPRAQFVFTDGIAWMEQADDVSLDLIIIDSTDPIGPAEGLFQAPFYQQCHRVLRADGIIAQQSESPFLHLDIIADMHAALRDQGFVQTDLLSFPQPSYPSGMWSVTLAHKQLCQRQPRKLTTLQTEYYNADMLQASLAQPNFIREKLKGKS